MIIMSRVTILAPSFGLTITIAPLLCFVPWLPKILPPHSDSQVRIDFLSLYVS